MAVTCPIEGDRVADAIEAARAGRIVMLLDGADERGPAALLTAAATTTAATVNFMVTEARGLVRLAITPDRCAAIGLRTPRVARGPYAFSVDARDGITNGASAADRSHTISVAVSPDSRPGDLVSPGHVFVALAGGAGTPADQRFVQAAVNLPAVAGLAPAGVICEVLNPRGDLAHGRDLSRLCARHDLVRISAAELAGPPRPAVERIAEASLPTRFGDLTAVGYRTIADDAEHLVLINGPLRADGPARVAVHRECLAGDAFHSRLCGCRAHLESALATIAAAPRGVLIRLSSARDGLQQLAAATAAPADRADHQALDSTAHRTCLEILADLGVAPDALPTEAPAFYSATTEYTGGRRVAALNQVAPASPEPNTSPLVAPK